MTGQQEQQAAQPPSVEEGVVVVEPEVIRQIGSLYGCGWGSKRIAAELGLARNTVRRYRRLGPSAPADLGGRPGGRQLNDAAVERARELLGTVGEGNAVVVQRLLVEEGSRASVRCVQRAVAPVRAALRRAQVATVRFETEPGAQMQIDFGQKWVNVGGQRVRVFLFVAVLGYSRRIFVRPLLHERQDDWKEGIAAACRHFGGVPETLLIDNPKAMVLEPRQAERKLVLHPSFKAFCDDLGVRVKACAPYRARTKGKTEAGVGYVKHNGLAGLSFTAFAALQAHLEKWTHLADRRVHGTTHERPVDRFRAESEALRPLPKRPLPVRQRRLRRKVANDALVNVDTVRYSVPHRFVRAMVDVVVADDDVQIYAGADCVASHRRSREPHSVVSQPGHYDGLMRREAVRPEAPSGAEVGRRCDGGLAAMGRTLGAYADAIAGGCHA